MSNKIDHLSISQINEYLGCSQQYFYHRVAKLDQYDTPSALVVGSAIHEAIEEFNLQKKQGVKVELSGMVHIFSQYLLKAGKAGPVNYGKSSIEEQIRLSEIWLAAFLNEQVEQEEVVSIEESFELFLPGLSIPVVGRVDAVVQNEPDSITVIDYKTAASKPSQTDIDSNQQMTLYGIWARQRWPQKRIKVRMDYLIKSKRTPSFIRYETSRTNRDEQRLAMLFQKVYNHILMLKADVIDPLPVRSWRCPSCSFRHACCSVELKAA